MSEVNLGETNRPVASVDNTHPMVLIGCGCDNDDHVDSLAASVYSNPDVYYLDRVSEHSLATSAMMNLYNILQQRLVRFQNMSTQKGWSSGAVGSGEAVTLHDDGASSGCEFEGNASGSVLIDHETYGCDQVLDVLSKIDLQNETVYDECLLENEENVISLCPLSTRLHNSRLVSGVRAQLRPET